MYVKSLVYRLSHDCNFDIDSDVSTAHCRSSSGDSERANRNNVMKVLLFFIIIIS